MCRKSERPASGECPKGTSRFCAPPHRWEYRSDWNGNDEVIAFACYPHGVARAGWRCFNCGRFCWDQSDTEFALVYANAIGLIKIPTKPKCVYEEWS